MLPSPFGRSSSAAVSRRDFLRLGGLGVGAAVTVPLLSACGSSSSPAAGSSTASTSAAAQTTSLSVQLSWVEDSEFSPLYLADANGHYKSNNVALKMIPGGSEVGAIEGIVAAGQADIGISTDITSVVAAIAGGNPLVVIGTLYQSNLTVFMSRPDEPITSVADLKGKRIGTQQGDQTQVNAIFALHGMKPSDYTFVPIGYGPGPLINKQVDVQTAFITDEVISFKDKTGTSPSILSYTDAGLPAYTLPIFTTTSTLKNKREALKGFLAGTIKGFDEDIADPTAGPNLAVSKYGKSAGLVLASEIEHNKAYVPLASSADTAAHGLLWVNSDYLAGPIYKGMVASGLKTAPVSQVVDMSLLTEIHAGK